LCTFSAFFDEESWGALYKGNDANGREKKKKEKLEKGAGLLDAN